MRRRRDADAAEVEPVGVPAGDDAGFALGVAVAVQSQRLAQLLEAPAIQLGQHAALAHFAGEVGGAAAVAVVEAEARPHDVSTFLTISGQRASQAAQVTVRRRPAASVGDRRASARQRALRRRHRLAAQAA
ncbi:MAG: hypothetical protein ACK595_07900, partial [Planctomycetota bacterium]